MSKARNIKPAKLDEIVNALFKNQKFFSEGFFYKQTFSRIIFNVNQLPLLIYPGGFFPLNYYIIYQTDKYQNKNIISSQLQLVSFLSKNDGYIYGYYFDITGQPRYNPECLKNASCPLMIPPTAVFTPSNYLESYNKINGEIFILSLGSSPDNIYATIQFSECKRYTYQQLGPTGLAYLNDPDPIIGELSCNLKGKYSCCWHNNL